MLCFFKFSSLQYFNPLPLYRGRQSLLYTLTRSHPISIHFLYTEEDEPGRSTFAFHNAFQSTSSIQRKTKKPGRRIVCVLNFNPLPLYRGRHRRTDYRRKTKRFQSTSSIQRKTGENYDASKLYVISIHFLYTEEDYCAYSSMLNYRYFNPLPLYRGRLSSSGLFSCAIYFNPLPLYRGRRHG